MPTTTGDPLLNHRLPLSPQILPARSGRAVLVQQADAFVVRQPGNRRGHRLNAPAAYLWQCCDGRRTMADLFDTVRELSGGGIAEARDSVSRIVAELAGRNLVALNGDRARPLLTVRFEALHPDLDPADNYVTRLLLDIGDIALVDAEPDIRVGRQGAAARPDGVFIGIESAADRQLLHLPTAPPFRCELPERWYDGGSTDPAPAARSALAALAGVETDPGPSPKASRPRRLTIGMATYDDYDGVYFSVQAIRMYHPEVADEIELLVIDNNPEGPCAEALRGLAAGIPALRYLPRGDITGTAVRDSVFREARTEFVMCIDCHVFIVPGALRRLLDWLDDHPDCADLLQGPLLLDDLESVYTQFEPVWREGMYGIWAVDERGRDVEASPFEIPMQGLGLAACRADAWPGYNPSFRGFGGEEGYIHQKFRNAGGKTLCMPFLRWMHRFGRPLGTRYPNRWEDRVRNYLIGFEEVGLDMADGLEHFETRIGVEAVKQVVARVARERDNPFDVFDAIFCINLDGATGRWQQMRRRFDHLGIGHRVQRWRAVATPDNHHVGCALSHRQIIDTAARQRLGCVLVLEDDAMALADALERLREAVDELANVDWSIFYLGGMRWGGAGEPVPGCRHIEQEPPAMTCTHAVAYHSRIYEQLLDTLPEDIDGMTDWLKTWGGFDQYLPTLGSRIAMKTPVFTQPALRGCEPEPLRDRYF